MLEFDFCLACRYDEMGKAAMHDMKMMDGSDVFGMAFGSDAFENYIGQLRVTLALLTGGEYKDEQARLKLQVMQTVSMQC